MATVDQLSHPVVRQFVRAFNQRDEQGMLAVLVADAVFTADRFTEEEIRDWYASSRYLTLGEGSDQGLVVAGVEHRELGRFNARWTFSVEGDQVTEFAITTNVEVPLEAEALAYGDAELLEAEKLAASTCTAPDGSLHPVGTLRLAQLGNRDYVHRCGRGAIGVVDWINTGTRSDAGDALYTRRDPAEGSVTSLGDNGGYTKVESSLTVAVGWHDSYQKATVTYLAVPYLWESVAWFAENNKKSPGYEPRMTITLTLTGPDGAVVSSEEITVVGQDVPYPLEAKREFHNLVMGTYRVTVRGVKTGGSKGSDGRSATGKDRVTLTEQSVEFTFGS
ncbi:hypothetical protein ACFXD5_23725 [Streptomyces sp. NPDC059385]|uniref:hypothetical protein n=1 Tax=Streptomyces sp. NPDC059385 TaxID=3346817 RepID=UPI0036C262F0